MTIDKKLIQPGPSLHLPDAPADWGAFYRQHLTDFVMPFWLKHGVDREHGGLLTCIDDAGKLLSTEKYMWSQTRGLWTFSALYGRIERRPEWLEVARGLYEFCRKFGPDDKFAWNFRLTREGAVIDGPTSVHTGSFAIMGLVEYARATGTQEPLDLAKRTFRAQHAKVLKGESLGTAPYAMPAGMKGHGMAMMCSLAFYELGELLGDREILDAAAYYTREILEEFIRPETRTVLEYVDLQGAVIDSPEGRAMVPGHGIESMWFQLDIFRRSGRKDGIARLLAAMEWCLEAGWDRDYGGLRLGIDVRGISPPYWQHAEYKLWWPVTEALPATLIAYEFDPNPKWLEWHRRILDWALARYPVPDFGEWRQRLDREGRPVEKFLVLPVKDPFHLPRGLIVGVEAAARLAKARAPRFV